MFNSTKWMKRIDKLEAATGKLLVEDVLVLVEDAYDEGYRTGLASGLDTAGHYSSPEE